MKRKFDELIYKLKHPYIKNKNDFVKVYMFYKIFIDILFVLTLLLLFFNIVYPVTKIDRVKEALSITKYLLIFQIVIIAPIFEEVSFRYFTKGNKISLFISASFSFLYVIQRKIFFNSYINNTDIYLFVFSFFLIFLLSTKVLYNRRFLYYISIISFVFLHTFNFHYKLSYYPIYIIYFFIYLLLSIVLTITRLNFGIKYSIMLHTFINTIAVFPIILINSIK